MKKLTIVFILIACSLQAQTRKLGKVTVEELQQKVHPRDSSAAAAVLFKKGEVLIRGDNDGNWIAVTEVQVKIKIYKKEGYSYADFEEEYYSGYHPDNLIFYDEATYNLVNGKVEKTKVKNESEFKEQKSKYYKSKKISFSNVKEGSIIEYRYVKTTYNIAELEEFFFQQEIPVDYVEYRVEAPDNFEYNRTMAGYLTPRLQDMTVNDNSGSYTAKRAIFEMSDVPAMKDEHYVDNINNYRSRVRYELATYRSSKGIENYATSWEVVVNKIYDNEDFGRQLEKTGYFEDDVKAITGGLTNREATISAIFKYVQSRMNWNEYVGYSCNDGVKDAYKNKVGNSAEINLMLVAMLRYAGIDANPVLVSTRKNGITSYPSRTAFNYVVAAVEVPNDVILLDATSKHTQPGILPVRAINWTGRIIRKNGSSAEVVLSPSKLSKEVISMMASIDGDGKISGKVRDQYADYNAYFFRENYLGVAQESYLEKLEKKYGGMEISDYKIDNDLDHSKPVTETYSFSHGNIVEKIGDKMYFSPMLFFSDTENPFLQEKRDYPVDFVFPREDKYSITLTLPDGYVVESVPEATLLNMESGLGTFKFNISANGKQLQMSVTQDINYGLISATYYETLKTFYKHKIIKQSEKIVLRKV
ncbi:MAG: DUF3857 domain-containing protein [Flavobacterium sp.]|nr:MAG: DUF3857 domain-containing protein [Flavobacterium sp.]